MLVTSNENKEIIKKYEELWSKIRNLISSVTKNFKSNSQDLLPLSRTIEIHSMMIVVRAFFHKDNKYYPQVFLDECLYKL